MTIIAFVVDTGVTMNQRTARGNRLFDVAKSAVESIHKSRRSQRHSVDKYCLYTFEEPPSNIKVGVSNAHSTKARLPWDKDEQRVVTINSDLRVHGAAISPSEALGHAFKNINLHRSQVGMDNIGFGRFPGYSLNFDTCVILITSAHSDAEQFTIPNVGYPASNLWLEQFRWDQRLYAFVLRYSADTDFDAQPMNVNGDVVVEHSTSLGRLCAHTAGAAFTISNFKQLQATIEYLNNQISQMAVTIHMQKTGDFKPDVVNTVEPALQGYDDVTGAWQSSLQQLCVKPTDTNRFWPIPETFMPSLQIRELPQRLAIPILQFDCRPIQVSLPEFPYDKFELMPSPLTRHILKCCGPDQGWKIWLAVYPERHPQLPAANAPFGYIKANTARTSATIYLLPYNFEQLFQLLDALKKNDNRCNQPLRAEFINYLRRTPSYYHQTLIKTLTATPFDLKIFDNPRPPYNTHLTQTLLKLKDDAKQELRNSEAASRDNAAITDNHDKFMERNGEVLIKLPPLPPIVHFTSSMTSTEDPIARFNEAINFYDPQKDLEHTLIKMEKEWRTLPSGLNMRLLSSEFNASKESTDISIKSNPYDVDRRQLIHHLERMRINFEHDLEVASSSVSALPIGLSGQRLSLHGVATQHNQPIKEMGACERYIAANELAGRSPLRPIEPRPQQIHKFGNPFKVSKQSLGFVDEADVAVFAGNPPNAKEAGNPRHRRRGMSALRGRPGALKFRFSALRQRIKEAQNDEGTQSVAGDLVSPFSPPSNRRLSESGPDNVKNRRSPSGSSLKASSSSSGSESEENDADMLSVVSAPAAINRQIFSRSKSSSSESSNSSDEDKIKIDICDAESETPTPQNADVQLGAYSPPEKQQRRILRSRDRSSFDDEQPKVKKSKLESRLPVTNSMFNNSDLFNNDVNDITEIKMETNYQPAPMPITNGDISTMSGHYVTHEPLNLPIDDLEKAKSALRQPDNMKHSLVTIRSIAARMPSIGKLNRLQLLLQHDSEAFKKSVEFRDRLDELFNDATREMSGLTPPCLSENFAQRSVI